MGSVILVRLSPANADPKIVETLVPSVTLVRLLQLQKQPNPREVTLFGMVTLLNLVQSRKA